MGAESLEAPEFKYSDRNVRENPELRDLAEAYIRAYGGDFEPLLNAKRELSRSGRLETRTVRVVLNCMRYDVNASSALPEPQAPTLELVRKETNVPFCSDPRPHYQHSEYRGKKLERCAGVPWEIDRTRFGTTVRVRARYAAAHTSSTYHLTSGKGVQSWTPPWHEMGQARPDTLWVDLVCKYPSILGDPMLFMEKPVDLMSSIKKRPGLRTLCPHCAGQQRGN